MSFTGILGSAGTSPSELANIELAFVPGGAPAWFPFDEDISKKRRPAKRREAELWEPDYTNGPNLTVYFPFDEYIPRKKLQAKRKMEVLEFPFARDIGESPWFPFDEFSGRKKAMPSRRSFRYDKEEPFTPSAFIVPIWPPPPVIAFKGLGLIARVPDVDSRLKRFTQQVSDMLNSLTSGGYIRRTGFQTWIISASPTFMTAAQLLAILETADGSGSGLDADLLDGVHGTGYLRIVGVPSTSSAGGQPGQVSYDSSYFYICVAANTWLRVAISTW